MAHEVVQTVRQRIPQKDRKRIEENLEKYEFEVEKEIEKNRKPIAENEEE